MKTCPLGKTHKWTFKANRNVVTQTLHAARVSLKGVYTCACGAKKYGEPR